MKDLALQSRLGYFWHTL